MSEVIEQSVELPGSVEQVYQLLTDSAQFAAMNGGAPADLGTHPGDPFSCFGGMIHGRQLELVPDQRIVQAWRVSTWPPGEYSIAHFEIAPTASGSRIDFRHAGFRAADREHLAAGWHANYWEPMARFLSAPSS